MYVLTLSIGEYSERSVYSLAASQSKQALNDFSEKYEAERKIKHEIRGLYNKRSYKLLRENPFTEKEPEQPKPDE